MLELGLNALPDAGSLLTSETCGLRPRLRLVRNLLRTLVSPSIKRDIPRDGIDSTLMG